MAGGCAEIRLAACVRGAGGAGGETWPARGRACRQALLSKTRPLARVLTSPPPFLSPSQPQALFQADHIAFSIFPVTTWAEVRAVCAAQLADSTVRLR